MTTETETGTAGQNIGAERDVAGGAQSARSEGTAVFVGRASFRMTPAEMNQPEGESADGITERAAERFAVPADAQASAASTVVMEGTISDAFFRLGETLVLSPPVKDEVLETLRLPRLVVVAANDSDRPPRRATPLWMVGAALVAGATVTLSAQAVMRRPPGAKVNAATAGVTASPASSVAAAVPMVAADAATIETATSDPVGPSAPGASALVVPSTATFPIAQLQEQPRAGSSRASGRPHHPRLNRGLAKELPSRKTLPPVATKWVDPFVGKAGEPSGSAKLPSTRLSEAQAVTTPFTKAKFTKVAPSGGPARPAKNTWVDPFAD